MHTHTHTHFIWLTYCLIRISLNEGKHILCANLPLWPKAPRQLSLSTQLVQAGSHLLQPWLPRLFMFCNVLSCFYKYVYGETAFDSSYSIRSWMFGDRPCAKCRTPFWNPCKKCFGQVDPSLSCLDEWKHVVDQSPPDVKSDLEAHEKEEQLILEEDVSLHQNTKGPISVIGLMVWV
jgi:hypothetical protein